MIFDIRSIDEIRPGIFRFYVDRATINKDEIDKFFKDKKVASHSQYAPIPVVFENSTYNCWLENANKWMIDQIIILEGFYMQGEKAQ